MFDEEVLHISFFSGPPVMLHVLLVLQVVVVLEEILGQSVKRGPFMIYQFNCSHM
jgi:hypothetical protein